MSFHDIFEHFTSLSESQQDWRIRDLRRQVAAMEQRRKESGREGVASRNDLRDELEVLHGNLARTLLLLHGLTTTLLRKQVISRHELQAVLDEIDLLDGKADGALDPAAAPGMQPRPTERRSTESALDDLTRNSTGELKPAPRDFLKELEDREASHENGSKGPT